MLAAGTYIWRTLPKLIIIFKTLSGGRGYWQHGDRGNWQHGGRGNWQHGGRGNLQHGHHGNWRHGNHGNWQHGNHGRRPPPPVLPPAPPPVLPPAPPPAPPTTQSSAEPASCFDNVDYVLCSPQTDYHPSVCDCGNRGECYIQMKITRNAGVAKRGDAGSVFSVNGGRIGPTIIINQEQILVVDVINNLADENTSIHWHGMHQDNMPWMDGVGMITQWPIPPNGGKFRYTSSI